MGPVGADYKLLFLRAELAGSSDGGAARERHKQVVFGEALLAMTMFAGLDPENIPDHRTDDLLDHAYDVMVEARFRFSPEDFALFFLSRLLNRVEHTDRTLLRHGAARYLIEKRGRLSRDIAALAEDAHHLLKVGPGKIELAQVITAAPERADSTADPAKRDDFVFSFASLSTDPDPHHPT